MSTELSSITSATSSRSAELLSWKRKSGKTTASLRSTFLSQFTSPRRKDSADRKSTRLNSSHGYNIVCRLLLEKKKKRQSRRPHDELDQAYAPHPTTIPRR